MNKFSPRYQVIKVFNNNVLWVKQGNMEKVLCGKGIGFDKKANDTISDLSNVDKVFSLEEQSDKYHQLNTFVDDETMGLCEEIIYFIYKELNEELNEKIHISLTDHIAFTIKRLKSENEIQNPFLVETKTLYKKEFEIADKAVKIIEERTGLIIPKGEIGFITLHIHSARTAGKYSHTLTYTSLISEISDYIEKRLHINIDKTSLDYARFVTHIRFTLERLENNTPIRNEFYEYTVSFYKESYQVAEEVAKIIEDTLSVKVVKEETAFIAIHIERLKISQ